MTDKSPIELDRALDDLGARARAVSPAVSDRLRALVLADAAEVAAEARESAAQAAPPARPKLRSEAQPAPRRNRLFGFLDAWSGAAVAAVVLGLIAGLGVGYEAGAELMVEAGFAEQSVASVARDGDGLIIPEDVL